MSAFNKVLISTDFSPAAWQSILVGLEFCNSTDAQISFLHVYPSSGKSNKSKSIIDQKNIDKLKKQLIEFCNELGHSTKATLVSEVRSGDVNEEVINYIKENPHDLVIIGVNSNGSDNHPGSHTASIIESSGIPVLVIPNKLEVV